MKNYNFGKRGWSVIAVSFVLYFLTAVCTTDGENIILPKLAEANHWSYDTLLTLASVAGCASVLGTLLLGRVCERKGPRFAIVLGLIGSAVFVFLYATAKAVWVYFLGLFGAICCGQSISFLGANALIANWFPRKKGLAMGIVTIGPPVATISMVSVMNLLMNSLGLKSGVLVICGVLAAVTLVCLVLVKDTPEECGCTPDNLPTQPLPGMTTQEEKKLPLSALFKTRAFWLLLLMMGITNMAQNGLMSQFLKRCTDSGFSEATAAWMMSCMAFLGIFGSLIVGNVENRIGTKKAYGIFALWFAAAFVLNFTNVPALMTVSIPMFGLVLTFMQIFLPAFEISIFGKTNFKQANSVLFPMISVMGQLSLLLISVCRSLFGEVRYAYLVFAALLAAAAILSCGLPKTTPASQS